MHLQVRKELIQQGVVEDRLLHQTRAVGERDQEGVVAVGGLSDGTRRHVHVGRVGLHASGQVGLMPPSVLSMVATPPAAPKVARMESKPKIPDPDVHQMVAPMPS